MLYKKNETKTLSDRLFENPTAEYRGTPFWSWNAKLEKNMLKRQMQAFKQMGFGGYHIHSRIGLATPYLGQEFMECVKYCTEYANENNMLMWAYDEDRYPSGFAGGLVTQDKKYRYRELLLTFDKRDQFLPKRPSQKAEEGYLVGMYDIVLDEAGCLYSYDMITDEAQAKGVCWYVYLRVAADDPRFNNQAYVDTLDKESIERFVEVTHERYKETVGQYFGEAIPSFFTDEPKTTYKKTLPRAKERRNLIMPWTDDFPDTFQELYGFDMIPHIPELVWELPQSMPSKARYYYHRHVAERFTESYSKTIADWCEANGVYLTGHMIKEPSLKSQSTAVGEAMLPLSEFGIPGIDMLCDEREYTTAKQAQSVAHQYGREGVLSELYGVTNWDFDFRRHKMAGDWQAALGVTVRAPHLAWLTMEGAAKRDYPASIHYQSPWYREYKLIEDYFARVNTCLTRGKPIVRIGVLHPVESLWLSWSDDEHTSAVRKQLDDNFRKVTEWLLFSHLDFDYISESVLERIGAVEDKQFCVGEMRYDVIVAPGMLTMRRSTYNYLSEYVKNGGQVIFAGNQPSYIDAEEAYEEINQLTSRCIQTSMEEYALTQALEPYRTLRIVDKNGQECNKLLCQLREDGEYKWVFVVYGKKKERYDNEGISKFMLHIKGDYDGIIYDALTGKIMSANYIHNDGETIVTFEYGTMDSMLLQLRPVGQGILTEALNNGAEHEIALNAGEGSAEEESLPAKWLNADQKVKIKLDEPNVYLLDLAEYALDDQAFMPREEMLRIGDILRAQCGYAPQGEKIAQPWVVKKEEPQHTLKLRYTIESEIAVEAPMLALEHADKTKIYLNGTFVASTVTGYYADEKIETVALPPLKAGLNTLLLELPFGEGTDVENSFLLGDFGVRVAGAFQCIIEPVRELAFGDIVPQGLPFYGGNIEYLLEVETDKKLSVRTPYFRGSLIGVSLDDERVGSIAFVPYKCEFNTEKGIHTLGLKLFGNRINTFGALHNCNENCAWFGPDAWRTKGDSFSYEYQLKKVGILKAPTI